MPITISLGPILIPVFALGLVTSLYAMTWVLGRIAPRLDFDTKRVKHIVERSFLVGIVAARLGFVVRYWESYLQAPWTVFFLWQPGYSIGIGLSAAVMFAAWRIQQSHSLLRRPSLLILSSGVLTGLVMFSLVGGLAWALSDRNSSISGTTIKDFTLQDLEGNTVHWSDLEGEVVLLNFWATWCPPCRREMPLLNAVYQDYKAQGFTVVGLAVGESEDTVRAYVDSIGVTYPVWVDGDSNRQNRTWDIFDLYGGAGLPTTLFVDRAGVIRHRYIGELSRGYIDSQIKPLLSQTNPK